MLLCAGVVAAILMGCGSSETEGEEGKSAETAASTEAEETVTEQTSAEEESYKIYLVTMDQIDQHWVNLNKGCEEAVQELGNVEYKWTAPDQKDDAKQIECINNAVADGAEAILVAANGPDSCVAALQEAMDAGVKVVYVDSAANLDALQTLSTDNKAAGKSGGEEMLAALKAAGITSGTVGIITPNAATHSNVNREEGFKEALLGTDYEILETQYSEGDAAKSKDMAANFIAQGVVGLFGSNEGCTIGIGNAIKEAETEVIGIGFDKSDAILELVKEGSLFATITQNPEVMGSEGIKTAVKALKGEEITEDYVDTGVSIVDKSSLN